MHPPFCHFHQSTNTHPSGYYRDTGIRLDVQILMILLSLSSVHRICEQIEKETAETFEGRSHIRRKGKSPKHE